MQVCSENYLRIIGVNRFWIGRRVLEIFEFQFCTVHFVRAMFGTSHFIRFMTTSKDKLSKFLMEFFSKMLTLMIPIEKSSKHIVILKKTIRIRKPLRSLNSLCWTTKSVQIYEWRTTRNPRQSGSWKLFEFNKSTHGFLERNVQKSSLIMH